MRTRLDTSYRVTYKREMEYIEDDTDDLRQEELHEEQLTEHHRPEDNQHCGISQPLSDVCRPPSPEQTETQSPCSTRSVSTDNDTVEGAPEIVHIIYYMLLYHFRLSHQYTLDEVAAHWYRLDCPSDPNQFLDAILQWDRNFDASEDTTRESQDESPLDRQHSPRPMPEWMRGGPGSFRGEASGSAWFPVASRDEPLCVADRGPKSTQQQQQGSDEETDSETQDVRLFLAESATSEPRPLLCLTCLSSEVNAAFVPCGHVCMCKRCAGKTFQTGQRCPICRRSCSGFQKLFWP